MNDSNHFHLNNQAVFRICVMLLVIASVLAATGLVLAVMPPRMIGA